MLPTIIGLDVVTVVTQSGHTPFEGRYFDIYEGRRKHQRNPLSLSQDSLGIDRRA